MSALRDFLEAHPRLAVLTGAGVSTSSGIPDYRDEQGEWKRARPVEFRAVHDGSQSAPALLGAQCCRLAHHQSRAPQ